jgi:hypothetical protein
MFTTGPARGALRRRPARGGLFSTPRALPPPTPHPPPPLTPHPPLPQMGVQVLVSDPKELEAIRQRESDITKERIQRILDAGGCLGGGGAHMGLLPPSA